MRSARGNRPAGRTTRLTGTAILLALALILAACGNSPGKQQVSSTSSDNASTDGSQVAVSAPGVTATEIRVGGVTATTNPLGGLYGSANDGVQAYFNMVNDSGGIYGRKLVLAAKRDDKLANNKSEVEGLLTQDNVFAVLPVATILFTGADLLVQQNVPTFGWNINQEWSGTQAEPRANLFGQAGSYLCISCATPVYSWLAGQAGAHKIGLLAYSVAQSADCADGIVSSFDKYGSMVGASVAFEDKSLAFGTADLSVQVSKMKDAGVDLVLTCMDTNGVVTLAKEMKKQGLKAPQYLPDGYDHKFLSEFGDLFEGSYVRTDFAQFELDDKPAGLQTLPRLDRQAGGRAVGELRRRLAQRRPLLPGPAGGRPQLQPPGAHRRHQQDDGLQLRRADQPRGLDDGPLPGPVHHEVLPVHLQDPGQQVHDGLQPTGPALRVRGAERRLDRHRLPVTRRPRARMTRRRSTA